MTAIGGATAAAMAGAAAAAQGSTDIRPGAHRIRGQLRQERFTIIAGEQDRYLLITTLDRDTAAQIAEETGLLIPFPPGKSRVGMVTAWNEDPTGKLCLGQGASGVFCIGKAMRGEKFVGLKIGQHNAAVDAEVAMQRALAGVPHVLQSLDFAKLEDGQSCQVMELAGLGSAEKLAPLIRGLRDPELREQIQFLIAQGALTSLAGMHARSAYHLDVKLDNLVVDHTGNVRIIDFDCAHRSESETFDVREIRGDGRYFSPERHISTLESSREVGVCSGTKIDAWAVGMLLYELISEGSVAIEPSDVENVYWTDYDKLPSGLQQTLRGFESAAPKEKVELLIAKRLFPAPSGESGEAIQRLLHLDPAHRFTPQQALDLPWFQRMRAMPLDAARAKLKEMVHHLIVSKQRSDSLSPQDLPLFSASNYVQRHELQESVEQRLLSSTDTLTVLQGGHGTGKSELAAFMLSLPSIRTHFGWILWLQSCDSASSIEAQLLTFAQELGIADEKSEFKEAWPALQHQFAAQRKPWLMVLDQAEEREIVEPLLGLSGGHVVLTTNSSSWPEFTNVSSLSQADAKRLVQTQLRSDDPLIPQLCSALAELPLALMQACAYIRNEGSSVGDYLEMITAESVPLDRVELIDGYRDLPSSIGLMFKSTFERLEESGALALAEKLSCLAPDTIPASLVSRLGTDEQRDALLNYAILRHNSDTVYSMHRLPQQFLQAQQAPDQLRSALDVVIDNTYASWSGSDDRHELAYINHGTRFIDLARRLPSSSEADGCSVKALHMVVSANCRIGRSQEAAPLLPTWQRLVEETMQAHPPHLVHNLILVADRWEAVGEYAQARLILVRCITIAETQLSSNPTLLGDALGSLGDLDWAEGRYAEAKENVERALGILSTAQESNARLIVELKFQLSTALRREGNLNRALTLIGEVSAWNQRVGDELAYAESLSLEAAICGDMHQEQRAMQLLGESKAIVRHHRGEEHPQYATLLAREALLLQSCSHYAEARDLLTKVLELEEISFGAEHPRVASRLLHLAGVYDDLGNYHSSLASALRSLAIQEKARIGESARTANAQALVSIAYRQLGDLPQSIDYAQRALDTRKRLLGDRDLDVATSYRSLANLKALRADTLAEAIPLYRQALAIEEEILGPDDTQVAGGLYALADGLWRQRNLDEAEQLHRRALQLREKLLTPNHRYTAQSHVGLAAVLVAKKETAEALRHYQTALKIQQAAIPDSPELAVTFNAIACLISSTGHPDRSIPYFRHAIEMATRTLPSDHATIADFRYNLARRHLDLKQYDLAIEQLEVALTMARKNAADPQFAQLLEDRLRQAKAFVESSSGPGAGAAAAGPPAPTQQRTGPGAGAAAAPTQPRRGALSRLRKLTKKGGSNH